MTTFQWTGLLKELEAILMDFCFCLFACFVFLSGNSKITPAIFGSKSAKVGVELGMFYNVNFLNL